MEFGFLTDYSDEKLRRLIGEANTQLKKNAEERKKSESILQEMRALAERQGLALEDVIKSDKSLAQALVLEGHPAMKKTRAKAKVKFSDGKNQWTGRGKTPKWVLDVEERDGNRDAIKIN